MQHLFPALPAHLLADALAHPAFAAAGSSSSVDEQAAPLVEAILAGTLPAELAELRAAAAETTGQINDAEPELPSETTTNGKIERNYAFDTALDMSRLRLKGQRYAYTLIPLTTATTSLAMRFQITYEPRSFVLLKRRL